jgi:uncharacterized lipoprotein YddW (UPF0748 family)
VSTVANIDWPSAPGLPVDRQLAEMRAILDRAAALNLNAIILQVRPACDAIYPSAIEPWSEYLTGRQGQPPAPAYDPLATWVAEAHRRGIELHAWFNPYRARHMNARSPDAPTHINQTHPQIVRKFNGWAWLDPGEPLARQHTLSVIADVVRRYDIDGVHIDDYFYPYASYLKGQPGNTFPDSTTYQRYRSTGGTLALADWRRDNVNAMVRAIHQTVKQVKPHVKFGISPFGIWRPNNPPGVAGLDQYEELYADARLWLEKGWCDYFTPQLYWQLGAPKQPYAKLLRWWASQNATGKHVWPGNSLIGLGNATNPWPASELVNQIHATRTDGGATGNVLFSMVALMQDRRGIDGALRTGPYARHALVPPSPWLGGGVTHPAPQVEARRESGGAVTVTWQPSGGAPWVWGVWLRYGKDWRFAAYPAGTRGMRFEGDPRGAIEEVRVFGVDRIGMLGEAGRAGVGG